MSDKTVRYKINIDYNVEVIFLSIELSDFKYKLKIFCLGLSFYFFYGKINLPNRKVKL